MSLTDQKVVEERLFTALGNGYSIFNKGLDKSLTTLENILRVRLISEVMEIDNRIPQQLAEEIVDRHVYSSVEAFAAQICMIQRTLDICIDHYLLPVKNLKRNSQWTHKNGNKYIVLGEANLDSERQEEYPTTVIYRGENGKVWSRAYTRWHPSMTSHK